jgi:hypothetical protein
MTTQSASSNPRFQCPGSGPIYMNLSTYNGPTRSRSLHSLDPVKHSGYGLASHPGATLFQPALSQKAPVVQHAFNWPESHFNPKSHPGTSQSVDSFSIVQSPAYLQHGVPSSITSFDSDHVSSSSPLTALTPPSSSWPLVRPYPTALPETNDPLDWSVLPDQVSPHPPSGIQSRQRWPQSLGRQPYQRLFNAGGHNISGWTPVTPLYTGSALVDRHINSGVHLQKPNARTGSSTPRAPHARTTALPTSSMDVLDVSLYLLNWGLS